MEQPAAIIVVDDEPELRAMVADYLGRHGFAPRVAAGGVELDAQLTAGPCDLILLDVNMPGEDGFSIARRLRAVRNTPILMLTAADDIVDRVVGLELGADDYITKPFDLRELRARIRTVLRRAAPPPTVPSAPPGNIRVGKTWLDLAARCLHADDGSQIPLTAMEFDLLHAFATHPNRVLSRDQLLGLAHNRDNEAFDRSIDVRITRIRRKIEPEPGKPATIKTVHGAGYIFIPAPQKP